MQQIMHQLTQEESSLHRLGVGAGEIHRRIREEIPLVLSDRFAAPLVNSMLTLLRGNDILKITRALTGSAQPPEPEAALPIIS